MEREKRIYPAFPGGKYKAFTMSYDDGQSCDAPLVAMMRKYGVKGTFNLNSDCRELMPPPAWEGSWEPMTMAQCAALYGEDMEIAVHGRRHRNWKEAPPEIAMADLVEDRRNLERLTGRLIRGGAYPYGTWDDRITEMARLAGLAYCRTTNFSRDLYALPTGDMLNWDPTVHHKDPLLMELAEALVRDDPRSRRPKLLYVWGHTFEIVKAGGWDAMERLLQTVGNRPDVWYATNLEIADYLWAMRRLRFDAEQTRVENPTAQELWLIRLSKGEPRLICVPAGAKMEISDGRQSDV